MSFQHVSGEYFVVYVRFFSTKGQISPDDHETATDGLAKAEFRLGEDGQVRELGVTLESEMGDAKIWFQKAGAENDDGYENRFTAGSSTVKTESSQGASASGGQRKLFTRVGESVAPLFA